MGGARVCSPRCPSGAAWGFSLTTCFLFVPLGPSPFPHPILENPPLATGSFRQSHTPSPPASSFQTLIPVRPPCCLVSCSLATDVLYRCSVHFTLMADSTPKPQSIAHRVPKEVLANILRYATYASPGPTFGGSSPEPFESWRSSNVAYPLPLVCRDWRWEAQQELVLAPVDPASEEEVSVEMVRPVAACRALERIVVRPLSSSVRDQAFEAPMGKPLKVLIFRPPLAGALGEVLGWNEALLRPSDDFLSPALRYASNKLRQIKGWKGRLTTLFLQLEINAWVTGVVRLVDDATSLHPPSIIPPPLPTPLPTGAVPFRHNIKLHFDLDPQTLFRLFSRCTNLRSLDVYSERRYNAHQTLLDTFKQFAPSLITLLWVSNTADEQVVAVPPPTPLFDRRILPLLSSLMTFHVSSLDIHPDILRLLPHPHSRPSISTRSSPREPSSSRTPSSTRSATRASTLGGGGGFKTLVVHDLLVFWGQVNVSEVKEEASARNIDFVLCDDVGVIPLGTLVRYDTEGYRC